MARKKSYRSKKQESKVRIREKRENDPEFREKSKKKSLEINTKRLETDPDFKSSQLKSIKVSKKKRQKSDPDFIPEQRRRSARLMKEKYETDSEHKSQKLESNLKYKITQKEKDRKFSENEKIRQAKIKKTKYQSDSQHKSQKIESAVQYQKAQKEKDPKFTEKENVRVAKVMRTKYQSDSQHKSQKLESNLKYKTSQKVKPDHVKKERARVNKIMKEKREIEKMIKEEMKEFKKVDKAEQEKIAANPQLSFREDYERDQMEKLHASNDSKEIKRINILFKYIFGIRETPDVICTSCEGLFFKNNPVPFDLEKYFKIYNEKASKVLNPKAKFESYKIPEISEFKKKIVGKESGMICSTCSKNLKDGKIPLLHPLCGVRPKEYYDRPECIKNLTDLEQTLISPIIPFMQIRSRTAFQINSVDWIKGGVVLIQPELTKVMTSLPMRFDESSVIQMDFKRNLIHKSSLMVDTINQKRLFDCLKFLLPTEIYVEENIKMNEQAFKDYDPEHTRDLINFLIPAKDEESPNYIAKKPKDDKTEKQSDTKSDPESVTVKNEDKEDDKSLLTDSKKTEKSLLLFDNEINYLDERNNILTFKNMSSFNSIFHGFHAGCLKNEKFKEFLAQKSCEFFKFILEIVDSTKLKGVSQKWIDFIIKMIPSVAQHYQKPDVPIARHKDMHKPVDLILSSLLNEEYHSYQKHRACDNCKSSRMVQSPLIQFINISKDFNKSLENEIHSVVESLNEKEKSSIMKMCLNCNTEIKSDQPQFQYSEMLLISIRNSNEIVQRRSFHPDIHLNIPVEIKLADKIYNLMFLIHEGLKHFILYVRDENKYIEINDDTKKQTVLDGKKFKVNPTLLVYFRKDSNLTSNPLNANTPTNVTVSLNNNASVSALQHFVIFENEITVHNLQNEKYTYECFSAFNSVFHGFHTSSILNLNFKLFIRSQPCEFFKLVQAVFENRNNHDFIPDWLQLIIERFEEAAPKYGKNSSKFDMYKESYFVLSTLLNNEYVCYWNQRECDQCRELGGSQVCNYPFISIKIDFNDFKNKLADQIKITAESINEGEEGSKMKNCTHCRTEIKAENPVKSGFSKLILVNVERLDDSLSKDLLLLDLFSNIPFSIKIKEEIFDLMFLIHQNLKEFDLYIKHSDYFIKIESNGSCCFVSNQKIFVNPVILAFFKRNKSDNNFNVEDIDANISLENYIVNNTHIPKKEIDPRLQEILDKINEESDEDYDEDDFDKDQQVLVFQKPNADLIYNYVKENEKYLNDSRRKLAFNDVMVIAPGQNKKPLRAIDIKNYEEKCFPRAYVGIKLNYDKRISYTRRIRNEINHWDRSRFHEQEIFFKFKEKEKRDLASAVSIALRKSVGQNLTKEDVQSTEQVQQLIASNVAFELLPTLPTSNQYLEKKEMRAKAMVRQFGVPTFFFTFSVAENFSPELLCQAYRDLHQEDISFVDALNLDATTKYDLIKKDPVLCVDFINHRAKMLLNFMKNPNGLFGDNFVHHFMKRAEIQMRGFIHYHQILWCKNAPVLIPYPDSSETRYTNENIVRAFIDKIISTEYLPNHPSMRMQMHRHTRSCNKDKTPDKVCRYHFPRYVAHQTQIMYPPLYPDGKIPKKVSANLVKIKKQMKEYAKIPVKEPFADMLKKLNMTMDEYYEAIRSEVHKIIILYRRETDAVMVNNYIKTLLDTLESNHDIQFITDAYGALHYLFKYVLKVDEGLNFLIAKIVDECRKGNKSIRDTYMQVVNAFHNAACISIQQALLIIKGCAIVEFSEDEKWLNTNAPERRTYLLKSEEKLEKLEAGSRDIYEKGLIYEYSTRPPEMENICFAEFGAWWTKGKKKKNDSDDESSDDDENFDSDDDETKHDKTNEKVEKKDSKVDVKVEKNNDDKNDESKVKNEDDKKSKQKGVKYYRRSRPRVIRFVNFKLQFSEEDYYREMVMLYHPWRNEETELLDSSKVMETFEKNSEPIFERFADYTVITEDYLEKLKTKVYENMKQEKEEEIQEFIADHLENEFEGCDVIDDDAGFNNEIKSKKAAKTKKTKPEKEPYALIKPAKRDRDEILERFCMMNLLQQTFAINIYHAIATGIKELLLILQGKAGVGKTFTLNIITDLVNDYFNRIAGTDFTTNKVLLCAPTGIAAVLLKGQTIHYTFQLNLQFKKSLPKLASESLGDLRREMRDIKVIIIDEYSMVSRKIRNCVDMRCREIFGINKPFGGKIVIFAGDLFQLPPVKGSPVYSIQSNYNDDPKHYVYDSSWTKFQFFELLQGVRQTHPQYQAFLDDYALSILTPESRALLMAKIVDSEDKVPPECIRLYYTNEKVDAYNRKRIEEAPGKLIEAIAEDTIKVPDASTEEGSKMNEATRNKILESLTKDYANDLSKNTRMRHTLQLKCGIRYKLTSNVKVSDGLAKHVSGTLVRIDCSKNDPTKILVVWMKFLNDDVGRAIRQANLEFMKENGVPLDLVPIFRVTEDITDTFSVSCKIKHNVERLQFPLVCCEASTFHSVQGLGIKNLCLDWRDGNVSTALGYVGYSRCDYDGLVILGDLPKKLEPRKQHLLNEMYRLRNLATLKLCFYNLDQDLGIKIVYHNVNSYKKHKNHVTNFYWYWKADIIILSEANVYCSDEVEIKKGFKVIYPDATNTMQEKRKRSMGLIIICRTTCNIRNLSAPNIISNAKNTYHIDLRSFEVGDHFIITGYRHPKAPIEDFRNEIKRLLANRPQNCETVIIGDMNYDINSEKVQKGNSFYKLMLRNGFINLLNNKKTNLAGSQIDIVFSTSKKAYAGTLASPFSDHFAIFYQTKIDISKLDSEEDKEFLKGLNDQAQQQHINDDEDDDDIVYNVYNAEEMNRSGIYGNICFNNDIIASIKARDRVEGLKFANMGAFNSVFTAFLALYKYTEPFQACVEGLEESYPIFKFLIEIHSNRHNVSYNRDQKWIEYLSQNYPRTLIFSNTEYINKTKIFNDSVSTVTQNLLTCWTKLGEKVDYRYASCERKLLKCPSRNCNNILDFKYATLIEISTLRHEFSTDLSSLIYSAMQNEFNTCDKCKTCIENPELIKFTDFIIVHVTFKEKSSSKFNIQDIPKRLILNDKSYALRIIIASSNKHPKAFYRTFGRNFLEMDDKNVGGMEFFFEDCKVEFEEIELLMYIQQQEILISDSDSEEEENEHAIKKLSRKLSETEIHDLERNPAKKICVEEIKSPEKPVLTKNSDKSKVLEPKTFEITPVPKKCNSQVSKTNDIEIKSPPRKLRRKLPETKVQVVESKAVKIKSSEKPTLSKTKCADRVLIQSNKKLKTFEFDKQILGDIPFPNSFFAQLDGRTILFKMMCPYNSIYSAFSSIINHTDVFRNTRENLRANFPFFNFICETKETFSQRNSVTNQKWINFLCKYFKKEITGKIKFVSESNQLEVNMEDEIMTRISALFEDYCESLENPIFSILSEMGQEFMITMPIKKKHLIKNVEYAIYKTKSTKKCSTCKKRIKPHLTFGECIVMNSFIINENSSEMSDQINNTQININQIQKRLNLNNASYELKSIIHHPPNHFMSYFHIKDEDFLEMNDTESKGFEKVKRNLNIQVNPKLLIYVKTNERSNDIENNDSNSKFCPQNHNDDELVKVYENSDNSNTSVPKAFENKPLQEIPIQSERTKEKSNNFEFDEEILGDVPFPNSFFAQIEDRNVNFGNMCTYNSIYSAFSSIINHTDIFENVKEDLRASFPFFNFICENLETFQNQNNSLNQKWIDFLHKMFENKINNSINSSTIDDNFWADMTDEVAAIVNTLFENYQENFEKPVFSILSTYPVACEKCNTPSHCNSDHNLIMNLIISKQTLMENVEEAIYEEKTRECEICKQKLKPLLSFGECIVIDVSLRMAENANLSEENLTQININNIQKILNLNNTSYVLKSIIHHPTNHFMSYYRIKNSDFLKMDDKENDGVEIVQKKLNESIIPTLLIYIKSNEKITEDITYEEVEVEVKPRQPSPPKEQQNEDFLIHDCGDEDLNVDTIYEEDDERCEKMEIDDESEVEFIQEELPPINTLKEQPSDDCIICEDYNEERKDEEVDDDDDDGSEGNDDDDESMSESSQKSSSEDDEDEPMHKKLKIDISVPLVTNEIELRIAINKSSIYKGCCAFNSSLHCYLGTYCYDNDFANYIRQHQKTIKYFETVIKLMNTNDQNERHKIWINFIIEMFKKNIGNSGDWETQFNQNFKRTENIKKNDTEPTYEIEICYQMHSDVITNNDFLIPEAIRPISYKFTLQCTICGKMKDTKERYYFILNAGPNPKAFRKSLKNIDRTIENFHNQNRKCCKKKLKVHVETNDFILIHINNRTDPKIPLSKIPLTITSCNSRYYFKFLVNFIDVGNPLLNHFNSYVYNYSIGNYIYLDDVGQITKEIKKPSNIKVFPKIIFYFKATG